MHHYNFEVKQFDLEKGLIMNALSHHLQLSLIYDETTPIFASAEPFSNKNFKEFLQNSQVYTHKSLPMI